MVDKKLRGTLTCIHLGPSVWTGECVNSHFIRYIGVKILTVVHQINLEYSIRLKDCYSKRYFYTLKFFKILTIYPVANVFFDQSTFFLLFYE